jgi:nucleoside-diphosphate-sugar epimerase
MATPKTVLVTGCAGFIGGNFIEQFRKNFPKTKIVGVDNFSTGRKKSPESSIIFYEGSILDENLLEKIFSRFKPEYVFHFAALPSVSYSLEYPRHTSEVNIAGTISLLEASKNHGVKRFIHSSSAAVYGNTKKLPIKESKNLPDPKSPYAAQKYAGELFCKIFSELFGLDTICLRYFNVFGPGQCGNSPYSTVVSAWLESIYFPKNKPAFIEGDGNQSRDFCYVDDVVLANILAMKSRRNFKGDVLNIAHGSQIKINRAKKLIEKHTGEKLLLEKRPPRPGDVRHSYADISKARKLIGYTPRVIFEDGLRKTVEWFKSRKTREKNQPDSFNSKRRRDSAYPSSK